MLHPNRASARRLASALNCLEAIVCPDPPPDIIIRFGHRDGADGRIVTLNSQQSVEWLREKNLASLYKLHRLPFGSFDTDTREVTVHVVDGKVVGIKTDDSFSSSERQKALGTAIRALYLAKLDFGAVEVKVPHRGHPRVSKVTSAPGLNTQLAKAYAAEISSLISQKVAERSTPSLESGYGIWRNIPGGSVPGSGILLGADPEFMLKNSKTGKLVPANNFFPLEGSIGCDQRRAIGEIRPAPQASPRDLTEAIRALLARASKRIKNKPVKMLAGSWPFYNFPIGGHIHFGRLPLSFNLIRALDNYLLIPLFLVERTPTSIKRRKYYGCLGDVRPKGPGRFEYRAPASWLVSPEITLAAFSLAKIVAEYATYLRQDLFADPATSRALYRGEKEIFHALLPRLKKDLEILPGYSEVAPDLMPLWKMIEQGNEWDEGLDLREAWLIS